MVWLHVIESHPEVALSSIARREVIDSAHPHDGVRAKFSRSGPFPVGGLRWVGDDQPPTAPDRARPGPTFELAEHVGWLAADSDVASTDPSDVVKQVSFLHASTTVTPTEFREHYRDHVALARRLMPSLWQYVQYDVLDIVGTRAADAAGVVAVSVLWFKTTGDFLDRYFLSAEDAEEFRSHEGFLDLRKAYTFVGTSHPTAGPAARP
jgi:hypothetical protein